MADEVIGLEMQLLIDRAKNAQTVGEVKKSYKDLTEAINKATEGTLEYNTAINALGNTKGKLKDLKEEINRLDPDNRIKAFVGVAQGIAGGFSAAQGAVALFAGENEDLQKVLVKTQAAVALAMGIDQLKEASKSWKILNLIISQNPLLTAAAVIGAVVAALAIFTSSQKENTEAVKAAKEAEKEYIDILTDKKKAIDLLNKDSLVKHKQVLEDQLRNLGVLSEATIKANDEIFTSSQNLSDAMAAEEQRKKNIAANEEGAKRRAQIKGIKEELDLIDGRIKSIEEKEKGDYKARRDRLEAFKAQWRTLMEAQRREKLEFDLETDRLEKEAENKRAADRINANLASMDEERRLRKLRDEEKLLSDEQVHQARLSMEDGFVRSISSIGELLIADQDKLGVFKKHIALLEIAIDTARGISSAGAAAAAATALYGNPIAGVAVYASTVAMVLANAARAKALLSTSGRPTGGGSAGGAANVPRNAPNIQQPQSNLTLLNPDGTVKSNNGQQVVKAYVVESELTATSKRVSAIQRNASF